MYHSCEMRWGKRLSKGRHSVGMAGTTQLLLLLILQKHDSSVYMVLIQFHSISFTAPLLAPPVLLTLIFLSVLSSCNTSVKVSLLLSDSIVPDFFLSRIRILSMIGIPFGPIRNALSVLFSKRFSKMKILSTSSLANTFLIQSKARFSNKTK